MTSANGTRPEPRYYTDLQDAHQALKATVHRTGHTHYIVGYGRRYQVQRARSISADEDCTLECVMWHPTWHYRRRR